MSHGFGTIPFHYEINGIHHGIQSEVAMQGLGESTQPPGCDVYPERARVERRWVALDYRESGSCLSWDSFDKPRPSQKDKTMILSVISVMVEE